MDDGPPSTPARVTSTTMAAGDSNDSLRTNSAVNGFPAPRSTTSNVVVMTSADPLHAAFDDSICSPRPIVTVFRPTEPSSG